MSGIRALKGLEGIRMRPHMYVGDVKGPEALRWVVEQALCVPFDDVLEGTCRRIEVTVTGGAVEVAHDGLGMEVEAVAPGGRPCCVEKVMTLFACRVMRKHERAAERFCGAGLAVTNALAAWFELEIERDGKRYGMRCERGVEMLPFGEIGVASEGWTRIRFAPDPEIFGAQAVDVAALGRALDEIRAAGSAVAVSLSHVQLTVR